MAMDARKQRILEAIVALYAAEGEPIGSGLLASYFDMALSSATLRNEMAALTRLGLLEQPHTSAGRVPSVQGYRYYLDTLIADPAAATLAGNAYGAGDEKRMRDLARLILLVEASLMVVSGSLLFAFAPWMMRLFAASEEVVALGAIVLRMVAVSEPFYGVSIIIEGMMQGVGNTMTPFICNVAGMWGVRIVGTFICTRFLGMGLVSAWACMILHNLLLFVLFTALYVRGRWNPLSAARAAEG